MDGDLRLKFPGLNKEKTAAGTIRWRVRVEGDRTRKITLRISPDHKDFQSHYDAARRGETIKTPELAIDHPGTMGFLLQSYLTHLEAMVEANAASPLTLKERRSLTKFLLKQASEQPKSKGALYHTLPATIPAEELEALKDRMAATPGKARNVWKLLVAAYDFGKKRNLCKVNPARAVDRPVYKSAGGAVPWSVADLEAFKKCHPKGSQAHLALTLFMFTACRIGDAILLGRDNEQRREGLTWLSWQPAKRGSRPVEIPMLEPLQAALRARPVVGPRYLLTQRGTPFKSPESLRNKMQKWCGEAGLENRSSHGIRKAAGHLLALNGATQYEIMSVHGHANASTSQVYTDAVERSRLGQMAAAKLAGMDW